MKYLLSFCLATVLMASSCTKGNSSGNNDNDDTNGPNPLPRIEGDTTIALNGTQNYTNVMGNFRPTLPTFKSLSKQSGIVRGYVKDLAGQPLQNAYIGIRSSAVGGLYSFASANTDEKGYYEISLPLGACHFWATAYTIDYGGALATVSLHPADGITGSFASNAGEVENFVLMSYGITNPSRVQTDPWDAHSYLGGSIRVNWQIYEDMWSPPGSLPLNSQIEITLTPIGETLYGENRRFIITKVVNNMDFYINNIPIGKYRITARLNGTTALQMKRNDFWPNPLFGLQASPVLGTGEVKFHPYSTEASTGIPDRGGWKAVGIEVRLP